MDSGTIGTSTAADAALLTALVEASPVGMAVFDASLRFVHINAVLADFNGVPAEAHLGRTMAEVLPDLAAVVDAILRGVLASGIAARDIPIVGSVPRWPGELRHWLASYVPIDVAGTRAVAVYVEDRTEQRAAQLALKASEDQFRTIAEALPLGLIMTDAAGRVVYGNQAAAAILGMTVDAATDPGWQLVIHPEDLPRVVDGVQRAIAHRTTFESEHRHVLDDGRLVWVRTRSFGAYVDGELRSFTTVLEDITGQRISADALRASELRFRTICEAAPLGIFLNDAEGLLLYANPAARTIAGFPPGELLPASWGVAVHPDDVAGLMTVSERSIRERSDGFEVEARVVRPDGSIAWTETRARELYDGDVRIGRVSLTTDVSERREMLAALHESETLFRELSENVDAVFYLARPHRDGVVVDYVSSGFERVWGRPPDELRQLPELWSATIHPDDRDRVREEVQADPYGARVEYRIVRPDGGIRWVSERRFPVRDPNGEIVRIAGGATDETERRTLEAQLLQAQRLESIGRLAGGVAHDFNNLLTVILSHAALARLEDTVVDGDLVAIEEAGRRATALTGQLLAFARRQVIEPRVVDLNQLTSQIDRMLRRLIGEQVVLATVLQPGLWPVRVDPAQMEQVLVNLAVNARDAMPRGGTLTIETANVVLDAGYVAEHADVTAGEYVLVAVSDTGTGIEADALPVIFEPFFTTKPSGAGTGLGLATCYGLVKQAGGHIWAYSEPGHGATFKVYLPRVHGRPSEPERPQTPVIGRGTETILVVEDDVAVRAVAVRALASHGFTVLEAVDGLHALEVARAHRGPIHLLLTDVVMPRMGGKVLAEQLQRERPAMRVLFASGYTRNAIVHQGVLEEGTQFLPKPYVPASLVKRVREALDA
ncbi:MAG: PAS domain S-box protein [Myxococcales bacterium]|nr:PAS domain S-box protein [Myxococcales bacterium]